MSVPESPPPAPAAGALPPRELPVRPARWRVVALIVFLLALAFGAWGLWRMAAPAADDLYAQLSQAERRVRGQQATIEQLQQRVATLRRSDQISREANRDLQGTLAERDEEVAALRADIAFYERLVGATAPRRGLTVHTLRMEPQNGAASHFVITLTQNLNRGAVSAGRLTLSVEGTRDGKLQRLDWDALRQQPDAPGIPYSFKYFQQLDGDVLLPPGLTPVRVNVRLQPQSGPVVEQSFTWAQALRGSNSDAGP